MLFCIYYLLISNLFHHSLITETSNTRVIFFLSPLNAHSQLSRFCPLWPFLPLSTLTIQLSNNSQTGLSLFLTSPALPVTHWSFSNMQVILSFLNSKALFLVVVRKQLRSPRLTFSSRLLSIFLFHCTLFMNLWVCPPFFFPLTTPVIITVC